MRRGPAALAALGPRGVVAAAALVAALVVAAPSLAAPAAPVRAEARSAGTTPVIARFVARTNQPKANVAWPYCVLAVTGVKVEPLDASVKQRLFDAAGNPIGNVGSASFYGAWCQSIKLPASIRGDKITLETKVIVATHELIIRTPIRVR